MLHLEILILEQEVRAISSFINTDVVSSLPGASEKQIERYVISNIQVRECSDVSTLQGHVLDQSAQSTRPAVRIIHLT